MVNHFLQSKEWEEFQEASGRKTFRIDGVLVIKLPLVLGKSYLYCAGTEAPPPMEEVRDVAKQHKSVFLKVEPMAEDENAAHDLLKAGFVKSKREVQPQKTIILDINKPEEQLLQGMHQKTRYNIRLAQKKSLKFSIFNDQFSINSQNPNVQKYKQFWNLMQETANRDGFSPHPQEYYEKLLKSPLANLFIVEHKNKIVAASIVIFYGRRATYLHGASDYDYRKLMAPYLLHWEIIKYAKKNGFSEYDFWGIDEKKWPGVTRFKRGFGGREVEYVGSYDNVFQGVWYELYKLRSTLLNKS